RFPAVARDLKISIVGPNPDQILILGRFADRINGGVHFRGRIVDRDATGLLLLLLLRIVGRQVWRNALPALSVIARAEQELRPDINCSLLVGRHRNRCVPIVTELLLVIWRRLDVAGFVSVTVYPSHVST